MKKSFLYTLTVLIILSVSCNDEEEPKYFSHSIITVDGRLVSSEDTLSISSINPVIKIGLGIEIDTSSIQKAVEFDDLSNNQTISYTSSFEDGFLVLLPHLGYDGTYEMTISEELIGVGEQKFTPISLTIFTEPGQLEISSISVGGVNAIQSITSNISLNPQFEIQFSADVDESIIDYIKVFDSHKVYSYNMDMGSTANKLTISLNEQLSYYEKLSINFISGYATNGLYLVPTTKHFITQLDSTFKFPEISESELLTKVQSQTFNYFYDNAGASSGLAKERNNSGNTVTSGGSGFGLMALIVAMERGFITRDQGLDHIEKVLNFLEHADRFHGAYSHWINDATGEAIPFSSQDNGGDLVETSFLFQGLLTFRQYMETTVTRENIIVQRINALWNEVEWDWYTNGGQDVLWWHWSPDYNFELNFQLRGYYEALITYVLAASSTNHTISADAYHKGWMRDGGVKNGKQFYGITLPIGYDYGGPLFFAHYSFLGLDPRNLQDQYCNYWDQNVAHSQINYEYCVNNPRNHIGYNGIVWGLTASDDPGGYVAHEPNHDNGTITPTAALSSMPYTPEASLEALKFFYYILGDRLWGDYGFYDAYNVNEGWWASSTLAIDQGPIICMIENYRTGLLWDLFMSAPEVQNGLDKLGFTY